MIIIIDKVYNNNSNNNNINNNNFFDDIIILFNFKNMYIIYRYIWSKNYALYNIKNYINHKNTITVSITISQILSLRLRCDQQLLRYAGVPK